MERWEALIKIFEQHQADSDYVAECVYAYLCQHDNDRQFTDELIGFLKGE